MDSPRTLIVTSLTAVAVVIVIGIYFKLLKKSRQSSMKPRIKNREELKDMKWESAGRVRKVMMYPVKSCAGKAVNSAQAKPLGLVNGAVRDRSFILCKDNGVMITARMIPSTVLIRPSYEDNILTLKFPGAVDLTVDISQVEKNEKIATTVIWGETVQGLDCGEDASNWLQRVLGHKSFLLYHANLPSTRSTERCNGGKYPLLRNDDHSLYADLTGHMLMTLESIADLQTRVFRKIAPEDFRPNILIDGTRGPYDEDEWEYIMIGDAVFRNAKPCTRCIFTTVCHKTGKKDPNMEPLRTLRKYRCPKGGNDPYFGINLGLDLPGVVREGDEVFVTRIATSKKI